MELLHNLWNVLITEDENLTKYICLPLILVEIYVTTKLLTTILGINYTKKQMIIYVSIWTILGIVTTLFTFGILNMVIWIILLPLTVKFIFKVPFIKSLISQIIVFVTTLILESIYLQLCLSIFEITPEHCKNIIIYRIPFILTIYLTIFLLAKFIGTLKVNWNILENLDKHHKRLLFLNLAFVIFCITTHFYVIIFYNKTLPIYISLISLISLVTYSIISIYSITKTLLLENTKRTLEQSELHNKSLELLYNNVSAFRHDISNIITALGGFIYSKNMDGLEKYYNKIVDELNINNNLSTLNPKVINNPAVYNILATKYYKADELGITINLQIFINLNDLKMEMYDFCRILGILLDNAIEAASKCEEKIINIDIHDVKMQKYQILAIENTYADKDIDISKLSEKGYTSKTENKEAHGIGLWQVSKIVKKHNNIILDTRKNESLFIQELIIYY